nr:reverse transcriptase domain-containing protein [Tanacetum cinerariifolium]
CGGAHPYYQCLAAGGNTFSELRDNIQGYISAAAINYNQGNSVYRPPGSGSLPSNTVSNPKGELKAITTRSVLVLDGPTVLTPPPFINSKEDERVVETLTDLDLSEYTIKVPPPPVQKYKPPSPRDYVVHQRDPFHPNIPYPSRMLKQKQQEKDEVQIHKFWQMFKQLHINITFADALILIPKYLKMLKALLSNKEKLQELANTPLNENCSSVILKKLPEKLGDPGKFLILCGFKMILRDGDERLTLNMRHDTSSNSNQPQKESISLINVFNDSSEDFLEDLFSTNQPSGNPTFTSHRELTLPEVQNDIFDPEGGNVLPDKLLDLDSTKDLHPPLHVNPLSGSTTYSSSFSLLLEELADELALITFPPKYDDDLQFDVESDLKEIKFLLHQDSDSSLKDSMDQNNLANPVDNFVVHCPRCSPMNMLLIIHPLRYLMNMMMDFSRFDPKPSTNNEDKVFNPGILIQENLFEIITRVVQDKKLAISNASLILEDFDPLFYELPFFKEVPRSEMLLPFSSENEEKVFKSGIHTSEKVHSSLQVWGNWVKLSDPKQALRGSIPGNLKTHAEGFCTPVFISSASIRESCI